LLLTLFLGAVALHAQESPLSIRLEGGTPAAINCGSSEIPVLSWSFGGEVDTSTTLGSGASAGKAGLSKLEIQKQFDGCSAKLFQALVLAKIYSKVTLTQMKKDEGGKLLPFMTVQLTQSFLSSYHVSGTTNETPSETVDFDFGTVTIKNWENGSTFCWDKAHAKACASTL